MQTNIKRSGSGRILFAIIYLGLTTGILCSCSSQKDIFKTTNTIDSNNSRLVDSFKFQLTAMAMKHQKELEEAKNTKVVFDDTPCPPAVPVNIDSCKSDSLIKIIHLQDDYIKSLKNKVKVNADGSMEYEGKIKSVTVDLKRTEKENEELSQQNTLLAHWKDSVSTELKKKQTTSEKHITKKWFSMSWVWIFLLGFILGCIFWHKRAKIWAYLGSLNKKSTTGVIILFIFLPCIYKSLPSAIVKSPDLVNNRGS